MVSLRALGLLGGLVGGVVCAAFPAEGLAGTYPRKCSSEDIVGREIIRGDGTHVIVPPLSYSLQREQRCQFRVNINGDRFGVERFTAWASGEGAWIGDLAPTMLLGRSLHGTVNGACGYDGFYGTMEGKDEIYVCWYKNANFDEVRAPTNPVKSRYGGDDQGCLSPGGSATALHFGNETSLVLKAGKFEYWYCIYSVYPGFILGVKESEKEPAPNLRKVKVAVYNSDFNVIDDASVASYGSLRLHKYGGRGRGRAGLGRGTYFLKVSVSEVEAGVVKLLVSEAKLGQRYSHPWR